MLPAWVKELAEFVCFESLTHAVPLSSLDGETTDCGESKRDRDDDEPVEQQLSLVFVALQIRRGG